MTSSDSSRVAHVSSLPDLVDFTDEEGYGKYLDLHEVYDHYLNLKQIEVTVTSAQCQSPYACMVGGKSLEWASGDMQQMLKAPTPAPP